MTKNKKVLNSDGILDLNNLSLEHTIILNESSVNIIDDFNELSEKIYKSTNQNFSWFFTSILSRNPNQSNLFLYCSYLFFIHKILLKNKNIWKIIVPSHGFKKVLSEYLKINLLGIEIQVISNNNLTRKTKNFIWSNFGFIIYIYNCFKFYISRNTSRVKKIISAKNIKLIDTHILQNSLDEGKYIERYYNGLLDFFNEKEKENIYFAAHIVGKFNNYDLNRVYKSSNENIIFKHDFLNLSDYLYAIKSIFLLGFLKSDYIVFKEFNIAPIIKEEISIKKYSILTPLINFRFFKRLKDLNIDLSLVVNWFENQPLDKGFNLGVKTYFPDINHIGYKSYVGEHDYNIHNNPTNFEVNNNLIPKILGVTGLGCATITKRYYKNQDVKIVPTFRHNYLWKFKNFNFSNDSKTKTILILLPLGFYEARNIMIMLLDISKKYDIDANFHIKTHPQFKNFDKLKKDLSNNWPKNFLKVSGDLSKIINDVNITLGTATSSCMESIALGIPTIIIGSRSNLTQSPIPTVIDNNIWKLVYSAEDLFKYISYYLNLNKIQLQELFSYGIKIKEQYFEEANREKSKLFLKL